MQDDRELETALSYYRMLHGAPEPQQKPKKPSKAHKPKQHQRFGLPSIASRLFSELLTLPMAALAQSPRCWSCSTLTAISRTAS